VIYGAGPVELLAAYSATLKGAAKVMIVDRHPDRLRLAESIAPSLSMTRKLTPSRKYSNLPGARVSTGAANASAGKRMIRKVMSIPT
jgi:hypothetical protein